MIPALDERLGALLEALEAASFALGACDCDKGGGYERHALHVERARRRVVAHLGRYYVAKVAGGS